MKSRLQDGQLHPVHRGVARRAVMGECHSGGRNFSFHPADPRHRITAVGCLGRASSFLVDLAFGRL